MYNCSVRDDSYLYFLDMLMLSLGLKVRMSESVSHEHTLLSKQEDQVQSPPEESFPKNVV